MNSMKTSLLLIFMILSLGLGLGITPAMSAEIPEAKPDKALIVFYRTGKMGGSAIPVNVHHSQGVIGTLSNGSTFNRYFEPGDQTFWVRVISEDSITLNVEAGKIYYVRGYTKMGLVIARPRLVQVEDAEARAAIAKLK